MAVAVPPLSAELTYQTGLGAGIETNDNIYLDPEPRAEGDRPPTKGTNAVYAPVLHLAWEAGADDLRIDYYGRYQDYTGSEGLNSSFVHDLDAELSWRRAAPLYFEVGERLSVEPKSLARSVEDLENQLQRNRLRLRTGFFWDTGPSSTVEVGYYGELQTYSGVSVADSSIFHGGQLRHRRSWSPLWGTAIDVRYGLNDREQTADCTQITLSLETERRWSELLDAFARLEWYREKDRAFRDTPAGETRDFLQATAWLRRAFERDASLQVRFDQRSQDLYSGDTTRTRQASIAALWRARLGSTLDASMGYLQRDYRQSPQEETEWGPAASVRYVASDWAACDAGASWKSLVIREEGAEDVEDVVVRLAAGLVFRLGSHTLLETGVGYLTVDSTDPGRSYTTTRAHALISVYLRPLSPDNLPRSFVSRFIEAYAARARRGGIDAVDAASEGGR